MCHENILLYAIRDHCNDEIAGLLEEKVEFPDNSLEYAAIFMNLTAAKLLVQYGYKADYNELLAIACGNHDYNFAKWCIQQGADVNEPNEYGWSPLELSISEIVEDRYIHYSCDRWNIEMPTMTIQDELDEEARKYKDYEVTYLLIVSGVSTTYKEDPELKDILDSIEDIDMANRLKEVVKAFNRKRMTTFLAATP